MLTNQQKALIKQAQRDARLTDAEYREVWQTVAGVSSSTDPRLGDEHMDTFMSYVEAIYWRKRDELVASNIFRLRGYWAHKNSKAENSRDRFVSRTVKEEVADLERQLAELGYNESYCRVIQQKVTHGVESAYGLTLYRAALARTLAAKRKKAA
jgi:hypothetical protein